MMFLQVFLAIGIRSSKTLNLREAWVLECDLSNEREGTSTTRLKCRVREALFMF